MMRRCALLPLFAATLLLTGCMALGGELSGQDADSLSVIPAADAVLETAENGKIYHYELDDDTRKGALYESAQLSPQQAANLAGMLFEDVYGLNQTGKAIFLYYTEKELEGGTRQARWWAVSGSQSGNSFQNMVTGYGVCVVEANTGELLMSIYFPAEQEEQTCVSNEYLPFVTVTEKPTQDAITAQVDRESKEFESYLKQEIATVRQFLYQARLYEREAIASVDPARSEDGSELYRDYLVTYKDERQARVAVVRQEWRFRESNWGEYPGREFLYCVPEVDPQEDLPAAFRYPDSAAREFFGGTQK